MYRFPMMTPPLAQFRASRRGFLLGASPDDRSTGPDHVLDLQGHKGDLRPAEEISVGAVCR